MTREIQGSMKPYNWEANLESRKDEYVREGFSIQVMLKKNSMCRDSRKN